MRADILFKDFNRSEYIENFVTDKIEYLVEHLVSPDNDTHVTVRLEKSKERTDVRRPVFQCEIIVKSGMSAKMHKAVKSDRNIFRSIVNCFDSMKVILGKSHDRLRHDRRRNRRTPEFSFQGELETDVQPPVFLPPPTE